MVRTRKRGKTYSYIFEAGKTPAGKRKVIEKGGFPTKEQAYIAGVEAYTDFKHGNIGITSEKISVKDYLLHWLEHIVRDSLRETTYRQYDMIIRTRLIPFLGNITLQDLSPADVDRFLRHEQHKGLARSTIVNTKRVLNVALKYAVYPAQLINSNVCQYVDMPNMSRERITKRLIISQDRFQELLKIAPFGSTYHITLMLMYHTGMRISEVLGLTWDCIQKKDDITYIDIKQQYIFHKLTNLKTASSIRSIPATNTLSLELERWRITQKENEKQAGYIYQYLDGDLIIEQSKELTNYLTRQNFICTRKNGKCIEYSAIQEFLAKHGLNAHSFRHTHATMLIENGASPKGVANRLGHSTTTITENLYTHITEKIKVDTVNLFPADKR